MTPTLYFHTLLSGDVGTTSGFIFDFGKVIFIEFKRDTTVHITTITTVSDSSPFTVDITTPNSRTGSRYVRN